MNVNLGKCNLNFRWLHEISNHEMVWQCVLVINFLNLAVGKAGNCHFDQGKKIKKCDAHHIVKNEMPFLREFVKFWSSRPARHRTKSALKQQPFERDFCNFCS